MKPKDGSVVSRADEFQDLSEVFLCVLNFTKKVNVYLNPEEKTMASQSSQRDHRRQIGEHLTSPQFWTIVKLMSYCSGCCKSLHSEHRLLATAFFLHFCVHVLLNRTMQTYVKLYFNSSVFC